VERCLEAGADIMVAMMAVEEAVAVVALTVVGVAEVVVMDIMVVTTEEEVADNMGVTMVAEVADNMEVTMAVEVVATLVVTKEEEVVVLVVVEVVTVEALLQGEEEEDSIMEEAVAMPTGVTETAMVLLPIEGVQGVVGEVASQGEVDLTLIGRVLRGPLTRGLLRTRKR